MKKGKKLKKIVSGALALAMAVGLTACGGTDTPSGSDSTYVYIPEWYNLGVGEEDSFRNYEYVDGKLYFEYSLYSDEGATIEYRSVDVNDLSGEQTTLYVQNMSEEEDAEYVRYVNNLCPGPDGSLYVLENTIPVIDYDTATEEEIQKRDAAITMEVRKVLADGTEAFRFDITEVLRQAGQTYIQNMACDGEGNLFLYSGASSIWVYNSEGSLLAAVELQSPTGYVYVNEMSVLPDGRMAIIQDAGSSQELAAYNKDEKKFSDTYKNLPPNVYNAQISAGINGGVLLNGEGVLYEYDLETQTYVEILKWLDCDLNPDYIGFTVALPNGDILVGYDDWASGEDALIVLKKTAASEVVSKEIITLGCVSVSQDMQTAVVKFNRDNEKYRINLVDYTASVDWSQDNASDAYNDAITQFKSDILTGGGPDLFTTDNLDLNLLAVNGVVEDLRPYLDSSEILSYEDFIEPVLKAYEIDGVLTMIPSNFYINTVVGRTSEVGEESGWTLDEMIALAEQYPDATVYPYSGRDDLLFNSLMFSTDSYVDWSTGECHFDTEEFKALLEFCNKYTTEFSYEVSEPVLLRTHAALLDFANIAQPQDWQLERLKFGEPVTAIGFPTNEGTGVTVTGLNGVCINAASKNKEAAWSFIESILNEESMKNSHTGWGFSANKTLFEAQMAEAMEADYVLDEEGNQVLDEEGNPLQNSHYSYGWSSDVIIELYAMTQQECDELWEVINRIDDFYSYDQDLMAIVTEEVESYFSGQKSVDEVAPIIQSRATMYINESR